MSHLRIEVFFFFHINIPANGFVSYIFELRFELKEPFGLLSLVPPKAAVFQNNYLRDSTDKAAALSSDLV